MSHIEMINKALEGYMPESEDIVSRAMLYSVENGGKRIRPELVLSFCEACGGDAENALPLACALEMIHTYSLIHDDLPCMDNDDFAVESRLVTLHSDMNMLSLQAMLF